MEVFCEYTEESIMKDAMEELKTTQVKSEREDSFHLPQANDLFENLEGICDLEELLGISENKHELKQDMEEQCPERSGMMAQFDDVFESLICEDGSSNALLGNIITNTSSSADCIDTSCVFSDTTEVITSSDLLGKLMSQSGIPTDESSSSNVNTACTSKKRSLSSDAAVVPEKLQKYSETDADECCSVYSSCASSPEDRGAVRRQKNNEASKVSRANRKAKQQRLFEREKELEKDNDRLRNLIEKMTKEAEIMRKVLVDKLSGAKCFGD